jgi:hypothetical protein
MSVVRKVAPLFALIFGLAVPARADSLYGLASSVPASLYTIDTSTGAATHVVDLTGAFESSFVDLAALNGTLYGSDILSTSGPLSGQFTFGTINATTGAYTAINNQGGSLNWQALAANPGANLLYAVDFMNNNEFLSVTPTGVITDIGSAGTDIRGLSFDTNHNILYGVDGQDLYTINTTTGAATLIGPTGLSTFRSGIAYDPSTNVLYMNVGGGPNSLYTLNTTTGAATLVGANGPVAGFGIDGIAFFTPAPAPEPATMTLLASGFVAAGGFAVCRRRRAAETESTR